MIEKFSKKFGFTQTELVVILFLTGIFILGYVYVELIKNKNKPELKYIDYAKEDSLFEAYSGNSSEFTPQNSVLSANEQIKRDVLGLNDTIAYTKKDISTLAEKSIDINTAGIAELVKLPGIGEKTAEKIIELRTERGSFKKLDELMDVKGIGEAKFNKIKKFLYIN